ncbi:AcvB/VirJ family lysyl-phosphatidylglycerol hydrolase [Dyadobacter sp. LHD-138]|uniref:AcvB/VirJ family lysyl-phosphatidylglycerol hydrolase n=1 Tax=Dyadobacter sp. LHD-138 TaxID=3071413 RepID=UPI0027E11DB4|nr:AcvB/VirJ family lysyl-phosphatidylglycerol hydrolase [Dyadobacter sp. LHD-138]MDQ6480205.1 AcvB/VirJ family lysyl-phosphatidylglycerol hydrolase [Dyadobacter sp. LHD-138]
MQEPFYALQGTTDQVCDFKATARFVKEIPNARLIALSKVGHGFSVKKNWVPQMNRAYGEIMTRISAETAKDKEEIEENQMKELPIHITSSPSNPGKPMFFFITGDGGYASFDKSFCSALAANGMPVVALDALKYFWNEKTPASTTADVEKLINLYKNKWQNEKIVLIGYSFGADVLPFVFNRMDKKLQENTKLLVMLSPAPEADFEIHITDMLNLSLGGKQYDVISEIDKMKNVKALCVYGSEEEAEIKGKTANPDLSFSTIPGGHHYDNLFKELVEMIAEKIGK